MRSQTISTKLRQIAEQASCYPNMVFSTLAHHMNTDFLEEAHARTRKKKSSGVDKVTATQYGENLEENLQDLYAQMRSGKYKAPPVKRVWIEKEDKSQRPIGIPAFEDKIVQRAVAMLLGAVFTQDFYDFSYGFIEGRSPHQAIKVIWEQCTYKKNNINWILDADVSGFFDNINHEFLRSIIKERVNDGGILRYIGKWLNAGVQEGSNLSYSDEGTPQGGVISPLLANIFLHHVLDDWFMKEVKPRLKGQCFLVRFADDCVPRTLSIGPRLKSPFGTPNNSRETSIRESDGHDSACLKKLEEFWGRVGGAVRKMGVCWSPETGLQEQVLNHLELH